MRMKKLFYLITTLGSFICIPSIGQSIWSFDDAHSNLQFSVTNLMVAEIEGSMIIKEAKFTFNQPDFSDASIFILADINTIDTDNDARDEHLRSPDFFDATKYPDLTFQSTQFQKTGASRYSVTGNLTFHGITKPVTMDVYATEVIRPFDNKPVIGFKATGTIKRSDYDISPETPSTILGDDVTVRGNVIFVKD